MYVRNFHYPLRSCFNFSTILSCSTKCLNENSSHLFTSIVRASIEKGSHRKALADYKMILLSGLIRVDHQTLSLALYSCKTVSNFGIAVETHTRIIKSGFGSDLSLTTSLIFLYVTNDRIHDARHLYDEIPERDFSLLSANVIIKGYLRIGELERAKQLFLKMPDRDVVSWNSMIMGCVKNAHPKEAIRLFRRMLTSGFEPDEFTFSPILSACAQMGALNCGEWVHGLMVEKKIKPNCILNSALIDMYSKCGRIKTARELFNTARRDEVSVWNSMITGLAIHGLCSDAIVIFSQMEQEGITPDSITFVGMLTGCSHCGLVDQGQFYFDLMRNHYLIEPRLEHYGTIVDLLARAGLLEEAYKTIRGMPVEPDIVIWRALLSGCRIQGRPDLAEKITVKQMPHLDSGDYVLLSNIYSSSKKWNCAENVRELMKEKGVRKGRGLSWVEISGVVYEFKAGDRSNIESENIYRVLSGLTERIKGEGFVPATELVLMDVSEEEKEGNLNCHSEKLAVAIGFLKTGPGSEILVSKNLRTCSDCHCWIKLVSKIFGRVIIVRDRVRFHRFENGICSCRDYW